MSIIKILKRVTDIKLGEIGFERVDIKAAGIWMYQRQEGKKKQELYVQKSQYEKGIEFFSIICSL